MLKEQLKKDMIQFMREKDKENLATIRMVNGAIKNKEIEFKRELTDEEVVSVITKEVKQYNESLEFAIKREDKDTVSKITGAIELLSNYLPKQITEEEAKQIIKQLLEEHSIKEKKQIGLAMKTVMPKLKGKYDGSKINKLVLELLS